MTKNVDKTTTGDPKQKVTAIIISIGNELLNGKTINTNAAYIAGNLSRLSIVTEETLTIRDDAHRIAVSLKNSLARASLVFMTGGLGPTHDDITKKAIADLLNMPLEMHLPTLRRIEQRFAQRGRTMPEISRQQALVPAGAAVIDNPAGSAPGLHFQPEGADLFVLPGVPREMRALMETILPYLLERGLGKPLNDHTFRTTGIGEATLFEKCRPLFEKYADLEIASLPGITGVDLRLALPGGTGDQKALAEFRAGFYKLAGEFIYSEGDESLESVVGQLLKAQQKTLTVAESCSGGLLQHRITDVPGSSAYFHGGIIAYSNAIKKNLLGVRQETLENNGAVSEAVAGEMAAGAQQRFAADYALSITGIAGPDGGSDSKPVGLVYIGLATPAGVTVRSFRFGTDRQANKLRSTQAALDLLRRALAPYTGE